MKDVLDIVKNIETVYDSNTAFQVLKDFERVLDELDLYVYDNWETGELLEGPTIDRHWITCSFMWPRKYMPDPMGAKRLLDYDCKVKYGKDYIVKPRKIRTPDDIRPGTKKGKLDKEAIWVVEIQMPKKLIADIFTGYSEMKDFTTDPATTEDAPDLQAPAAPAAGAAPPPPPPAAGGAPGGEAGGETTL